MVGRVGLWEGGAAQALFTNAPDAVSAGPPTFPFHPIDTLLSSSAPTSDLAAMEIAEPSMLFFAGSVHHILRFSRGTVSMRSPRSTSPCRALLPRCGRPRCGIWSTLPQRGGRPHAPRLGHGQSHAHVITRCAGLCVCFVYWQMGRNSREIGTKSVRLWYECVRTFLPRCGRPHCGICSTQPQRGGRPNIQMPGHGQSHVHVIARCACLCVCFLDCQIGRNSREIPTNFVRNSRECLFVNTEPYVKFP